MKTRSVTLLAVMAPCAAAIASSEVVTYFNGGDGSILANAVNTDYSVVNLSFLMPDASNNNQLGFDAEATTFLGQTITTGVANGVRDLQAAGKKVMLSFGGADVTSAQYAALSQNIPALAQSITSFVLATNVEDGSKLHFSGVDIDWEDTYAFTNPTGAGYDGRTFLENLTTDLRADLPQGQYLLTQAPQPPYLSNDPNQSGGGIGGYIDVLNTVGSKIDWINMQYYNNPGFNTAAQAVTNYKAIVNGWSGIPGIPDFNGLPADKLLVGKPVNSGDAGSGYLPVSSIVSGIVDPLVAQYGSDFGGVFGWQLTSDPIGAWASTLSVALIPEPSVCTSLFGVMAGLLVLVRKKGLHSRARA